MIFLAPMIILQLECARQKKEAFPITNSMRSMAMPQVSQIPPITPVYAKELPGAPAFSAVQPSNNDNGTPEKAINVDEKVNAEKTFSKGSIETGETAEKEKYDGTASGKGGEEGQEKEGGEKRGREGRAIEERGDERREKRIINGRGDAKRDERAIYGRGEGREERNKQREERIVRRREGKEVEEAGEGGEQGGDSVEEEGGKKDDGYNECPDLTPEILKSIINSDW